MAEHEPDGVQEAFTASARVAITAGGLMAERIARQREQAMRDAQAVSEQATRELQSRLDAERGAARAALQPLSRDEWWERATPEQIGEAWETAQAWRHEDPAAERAAVRVRDEMRTRYAIDVDSLDADPGAVQDALDRRERALALSREAREKAARDEATAGGLLITADRADRLEDRGPAAADRDGADALYDSADRRRELAERLSDIADDETVEAVVLADTNQARPPEEAVASAPSRAPAARRSRGKTGPARSGPRRSDRGR